MTDQDPRPLAGEPLAIDLLNTRWTDGADLRDLLVSTEGLAGWLASDTVARELRGHQVRADRGTLDALLQAREALAAVIDEPGDPAGRLALNAVLGHGRVRFALGADGPVHEVETDRPRWLPAWAAADNYLRLLGDRPDRIRRCAGQDCVLHFYDTSKNGTRRWCSMAGCGNRAKASRHYARHKRD
ncbi:CGNR zinc finger domain-containing protein [Streptomyces sp. NPDC050485]|uniref:CGNR zinc finger domain-containing protein n=1 Tax=Streptomyces sp. NPDC050485 TaxID=3365617 RepID=UPI0037ABFE91